MQNLAQGYNNYITLEARHAALNHLFFSVAQMLAACDGAINDQEKQCIKKEFPYFEDKAELFSEDIINQNYLYFCCRRLLKFCKGNTKTISNFIIKIFKVAVADGVLNVKEIELLEKLAEYLGLPEKVLNSIFEIYFSAIPEVKLKKLKKSELRKEISFLHPDKFYSLCLRNEKIKLNIIHLANNRLKLLNEYYKKNVA